MVDYVKVDGVAAADIVTIDGVAVANVVKRNALSKPSAAQDWNTSLWMDDTLTDDKGDWSSGQGKRSYASDNLVPCDQTCIPYIDDSSGTKYLKFMFGYSLHPGDDFLDLMEGERVGFSDPAGASADNVHKSATGIAFDGNNLVTGTHTIRFEVKHDASKNASRKWWTFTVVMNCTESSGEFDIYWYVGKKNAGGGVSPAPTSIPAADVIAQSGGSGVTYWVDMGWRWTASSEDWSLLTNNEWWRSISNNATADVSALGDGSGMQKLQTAYYVDDDTDDHTMWEVTTAST